MLGIFSDNQKSDWKSHLSTLSHAYNAAAHESRGAFSFYLMFGRHPRLVTDAFWGLNREPLIRKSHQDYADKLKGRLNFAYDLAKKEAIKATEKHKKYYDQKVKHVELQPGGQVLIWNVGIIGKHKLANIWNKHTYIVKRQPIPGIPVLKYNRKDSD